MKTGKQIYTGVVPCNLFTLCDDEDALMAMKWLKEKVICSSGKDFTNHCASLSVGGGSGIDVFFGTVHLHFLHIIRA